MTPTLSVMKYSIAVPVASSASSRIRSESDSSRSPISVRKVLEDPAVTT